MKRTVQQFAVCCSVACSALLLAGFVCFSTFAFAAGVTGSVSGVVRDSEGTPQIGVVVELVRADASLAARVFTDHKGSYRIPSVLPGKYALKAVASSFIPALRQNVQVRTNTVLDLTLNTLYDVMQWVPQAPRRRADSTDDWDWTLRTAQSRPLLRWLDDGSPILVSDESTQEAPRNSAGERKLKALATAGSGRFGEGGEQVSLAMQQDTSARRRLAMSAQANPNAGSQSATMEAMLGFRQEMPSPGMGSRSIQTLAAVIIDPAAGAGSQQGLEAVSMRTWESMQVMDDLEAEAGSDQVLARVGDGSSVTAALPFAHLVVHHGASAFEYRVATSRTSDPDAGDSVAAAWLPVLSERAGELVLEHGLHQELGWSTSIGPAEMQLVIFGDHIENPMIEASARLSAGDEAQQWMLVDKASGLIRAAGPNYSTAGMLASVESRLPGHNRVKLSYASGDALVVHATLRPEDVGMILAGAHSHRAQMYSVVLSGTAEGIGTRWRASYRWQPEDTVTQVAPFAVGASEPYFNVYIRQPIHWVSANHQGPGSVEALLDLRNLLAEGYQPFLTSDGSHLYFAQAQRSIRGGLAFNF